MGFSKFPSLILRLILFIFISATLVGCAIKGKGPLFALEEPGADEAIVFHYRVPSFIGSALQYDVLSNGTPLTSIGNGGFFKQRIKHGHTIFATRTRYKPRPWVTLDELEMDKKYVFVDAYMFNAEEGKLYFLRWTPHLSNITPTIEPVPREKALKQMKGLRSFLPAPMPKE